ncbi:helix-turn-helix domain-containing protein [Hoyosella sp. YIM 151337]|uniref:PucR family transcriptional regulator n=1 Tax=Hoyosella sp. YIM 151337 TaxID=2992742 RepID=UPI0022359F43|nr:PucR family transcriptional regulator [Hoyosella sp. YIM 151337]MCW4354442.1 helix-turn-helix domain-containing protein [Hoyosella sp. YIM 151337]
MARIISGLSSRLAAELLTSVDSMAGELASRIVAADRYYSDAPLLTPEQLREACEGNLRAIVDVLAGAPANLDAARSAGRVKAEQGVPIAALLHAYRLGGRLIWEELTARAAGPGDPELHDLAARLWEAVDVYSDAAVEAYQETEILLAHADAQTQNRWVRSLFDDHRENPARVLEALRTLGLPEGGPFAVTVIETNGDPILPSTLAHTIKAAGTESVWDVQTDSCIGLLAGPPGAIERAVDKLAPLGRTGLSAPFTSPHRIFAAVSDARTACRSAAPGCPEPVRFGDAPLAHLVVTLPDASRRAAAQILGPVLSLPQPERDDLIDVLHAWFRCGGSAAAVADALHCHRNTVRYRLRKIRDVTGRDTTDPAQSAELYLALQAVLLL